MNTEPLPGPILLAPQQPSHFKRIILPWEKPPLSMNDSAPASKGAVYAKAATIREIQQAVRLLARNVRLPEGYGYMLVQLNYRPRDNRARDTDNLAALLKPVCDALGDGSKKWPGLKIVATDTPKHMGKPEPIIWPAKKGARGSLWLDLWAVKTPPEPYI